MKPTHILSIAALQAGVVSAACTREGLTSAIESFFNAKGASAAVAPGAKFTQNNVVVPSLAQTSIANITGSLKPFKVNAIDTAKCEISTLRVPLEGKDKAFLSLRLKLDSAGKAATEVEVLNAGPGSHSLWRPEAMPEQPEAWFTEKLKTPATAESLQAVANSYVAGIQEGDGSKVPVTDDCVRFENGQKMPFTCNGSFWMFKAPTLARRFVVDTETGVVQLNFVFDFKAAGGLTSSVKDNLWLHEYFKIEDGKIRKIYAAMQNYKGEYKDAWATAAPK